MVPGAMLRTAFALLAAALTDSEQGFNIATVVNPETRFEVPDKVE